MMLTALDMLFYMYFSVMALFQKFPLTIPYHWSHSYFEVFFSYPYGLRQRGSANIGIVAVSVEFLADTSGIICYEENRGFKHET